MKSRVDCLRKYLQCFQDKDNSQWYIIENEMGKDLSGMGVNMDAFTSYRNEGLPEELLGDKTTLEQARRVFDQVSYDITSCALFSMWRNMTHWLEADPRGYFNFCIAALERLIALEEMGPEM